MSTLAEQPATLTHRIALGDFLYPLAEQRPAFFGIIIDTILQTGNSEKPPTIDCLPGVIAAELTALVRRAHAESRLTREAQLGWLAVGGELPDTDKTTFIPAQAETLF